MKKPEAWCKMGVTTNDIARICQVSRTTVIRALNNQGRISKETKDRIVKTAEELGYRPDLLARGLVKGKTRYLMLRTSILPRC